MIPTILLALSQVGLFSQVASGQVGIQVLLGASSPPPVTWTLIQHKNNFTCSTNGSGTATCTVSGLTSTTAGDLLILASAAFTSTETSTPSTNTPSGDGTWTHCSACALFNNYEPQTYESVDGYYILSATGGATSVTFSWTFPAGTNAACVSEGCEIDVEFLEVRRSTGTASFDVGNTSSSSNCTTCTGPALTLGGSSDYIAQWLAYGGDSIASISGAAYTNPTDIDNSNVFGAYAGALNQSSGSAQTWTGTSSGGNAGASMAAMAFK